MTLPVQPSLPHSLADHRLRSTPCGMDLEESAKWLSEGEEWLSEVWGIPGVENILLELLEKKDGRLLPNLAVRGLGFVGTAKCVPVLAELARDKKLEFDAISSLERLTLPGCVQPLARSLNLSATLITTRYYAAQGLAKIANSDAIEVLEESLTIIQDEEQRLKQFLTKAKNIQSERLESAKSVYETIDY